MIYYKPAVIKPENPRLLCVSLEPQVLHSILGQDSAAFFGNFIFETRKLQMVVDGAYHLIQPELRSLLLDNFKEMIFPEEVFSVRLLNLILNQIWMSRNLNTSISVASEASLIFRYGLQIRDNIVESVNWVSFKYPNVPFDFIVETAIVFALNENLSVKPTSASAQNYLNLFKILKEQKFVFEGSLYLELKLNINQTLHLIPDEVPYLLRTLRLAVDLREKNSKFQNNSFPSMGILLYDPLVESFLERGPLKTGVLVRRDKVAGREIPLWSRFSQIGVCLRAHEDGLGDFSISMLAALYGMTE